MRPSSSSKTTVKGPLFIIRAEQAASYWMPDRGGYTNTIISPDTHPMLGYSMGIQRLERGEAVPEHFHDRHEELFYVYEGRGEAVLDGEVYAVEAGDTLFFGRNISHALTNTGTTPLSWVWVFNPPGLEHVLAGIGTPRDPALPAPAIVERPATIDPIVRVVTKRGRPAA